MKHVFIINPAAGRAGATDLIPAIHRYFKTHGGSYEIALSAYEHHAMHLAKQYAQAGFPVRLYACGGDGTLFDVVNGSAGYSNVEIGAIPFGSGNDFIRTFGDTSRFLDLNAQVCGSAIPVDLIRFEDIYAINACSLGMDAAVVYHKNKRKWLHQVAGAMAYSAALFISFLSDIKNHFIVTIEDEEPIERDFLFVVAANGRFYGGGYQPAPGALLDDGLMDVLLVNAVSRTKVVSMLSKYRRGLHVSDSALCTLRTVRKLTVQAAHPVPVNIDGEIYHREKAEFELLPHAVQFILPSIVTAKDKRLEKLRQAMGPMPRYDCEQQEREETSTLES